MAGIAEDALAQAPRRPDWTSGSSLGLFAGAATDGSRVGAVGGGTAGWEVAPQLSVEGTVSWFSRGHRTGSFSADFTALFALVPPRRTMPYVKAGVGLYHTWLDSAESPIPDFYSRRLEDRVLGTTETFTDPAIVVGTGVRLWLSERWVLRPELDAKAVVNGSRAYWMTSAAVRLAYSFVERPINDVAPRP